MIPSTTIISSILLFASTIAALPTGKYICELIDDTGFDASKGKTLEPYTLYLGFNKPQRSDYHRFLYATNEDATMGTVFEAIWDGEEEQNWSQYIHEMNAYERLNPEVTTLMISIGVKSNKKSHREWLEQIRNALKACDANLQASKKPDFWDVRGNKALKGYSCITWTFEALQSLWSNGLALHKTETLVNHVWHQSEMRDVGAFEARARLEASAGIKDGSRMVDVDHGPVRIRDYRDLTKDCKHTAEMETSLGLVEVKVKEHAKKVQAALKTNYVQEVEAQEQLWTQLDSFMGPICCESSQSIPHN